VGESTLPPHVASGLAGARDALDALLSGADLGRRAREGARLAIVGRPNVGKSSLFNALLGESRALVTALPGTTRDAVSERLDLSGIPVRLIDTAGVRDAAEGPVEQLGIARRAQEVEGADLVLWVLDASAPWSDDDARLRAWLDAHATVPVCVALNKCDLPRALAPAPADAVPVSATQGTGLAPLRARLAELLGAVAGGGSAEALVTNARHIAALRRARAALAAAWSAAAREGLPGEIVAGEIRVALESLGEVTGEAVAPDLLERIFARFCVGK